MLILNGRVLVTFLVGVTLKKMYATLTVLTRATTKHMSYPMLTSILAN